MKFVLFRCPGILLHFQVFIGKTICKVETFLCVEIVEDQKNQFLLSPLSFHQHLFGCLPALYDCETVKSSFIANTGDALFVGLKCEVLYFAIGLNCDHQSLKRMKAIDFVMFLHCFSYRFSCHVAFLMALGELVILVSDVMHFYLSSPLKYVFLANYLSVFSFIAWIISWWLRWYLDTMVLVS